jgi:hypothetical protein
MLLKELLKGQQLLWDALDHVQPVDTQHHLQDKQTGTSTP